MGGTEGVSVFGGICGVRIDLGVLLVISRFETHYQCLVPPRLAKIHDLPSGCMANLK